jgi:hypothetical protein
MFNWSQACTAQLNRPLWQKHQANYGGNLFAVSDLPFFAAAVKYCCACACALGNAIAESETAALR